MSRIQSFEQELSYECGDLSHQLQDDMSAIAFDPDLGLYIVSIKKDCWAPGLWAGTEGLPILWEWTNAPTERFTIVTVDLKNGQLYLRAYSPVA